MSGTARGFVWLTVILAVALVAVVAGGAILVVRERERAATEEQLAAASRLRLADEKRKTAEAERRAREAKARAETAKSGAGTTGRTGGGGLSAFRGRKAWVVTKTRPAKDYCAMLRGAGVTVRCAYATNKVGLQVLILRCPSLTAAHGRALLRALGLNLRINNWQRENACGKYHEITIYLND